MKRSPASQLGFTLIEMIVSLGLFSIVITVSVGALLVLIATNEQLQAEQSVMTNLSFALDSMSREIRTGTNYYCDSEQSVTTGGPNNIFKDGNNLDGILGDSTNDCSDGLTAAGHNVQGVAFKEGGNSITGSNDHIVYFYDRSNGQIFRRIGTNNAQSIISSGIYITDAEFYVSGSDPLSSGAGEQDQSTVTIFIEARENSNATSKPYQIQTTITQRTLDI